MNDILNKLIIDVLSLLSLFFCLKYISNKSQKINNLNRVNGYSLSQKRGTFSNFSINKIIQITNPRSKSKSPKRNYSANPHYKNKDQKKEN